MESYQDTVYVSNISDMRWTAYDLAENVGKYRCQGYDTFGSFKLVGGLAKGR